MHFKAFGVPTLPTFLNAYDGAKKILLACPVIPKVYYVYKERVGMNTHGV